MTSKKILNTRIVLSFFSIFLLIILLIFPIISLSGAKNGLLLWFNIIMPTLLPFIIVSNLMIQLNLTSKITTIFHPFFKVLFGTTREGSYPIVVGMISGLPVGAKACNDLVTSNRITKAEGQFLLTFCNNISPMFLLSYVAISTLHIPNMKYSLLIILYLSSLFTALLYKIINRFTHPERIQFYNTKQCNITCHKSTVSFRTFDEAIMSGFEVLAKVGGYIILFSILSEVILSVIDTNSISQIVAVSLCELTNGVNILGASTLPLSTKIALIVSISTFGGFSSIAQTKSVIDESGLSIRIYTRYKMIQSIIAYGLIQLLLMTSGY